MTGRDRDQQPTPTGTRSPAYVAELWVSAQLRKRIQRVLDSAPADRPKTREPDALPQPDMEAEP